MSSRLFLCAAALALALSTTGLSAQDGHDAHQGHDMHAVDGGQPKGDGGPSSLAFLKANAEMHAAMDITFTGDADVDFVRGMIGHHLGAIAMARVQLEFGKDPEIRALSEAIIAAQEKEVADMRAWLAARGLE